MLLPGPLFVYLLHIQLFWNSRHFCFGFRAATHGQEAVAGVAQPHGLPVVQHQPVTLALLQNPGALSLEGLPVAGALAGVVDELHIHAQLPGGGIEGTVGLPSCTTGGDAVVQPPMIAQGWGFTLLVDHLGEAAASESQAILR